MRGQATLAGIGAHYVVSALALVLLGVSIVEFVTAKGGDLVAIGALIAATSLLPFLLYLMDGKAAPVLPLFEAHCVFYGVTYGVPLMLAAQVPGVVVTYSSEAMLSAAQLTWFGLAGMVVANRLARPVVTPFIRGWDPLRGLPARSIRRFAVFIAVAGLIFFTYSISIPTLTQLMNTLSLLGIALLFHLQLSGQLRPVHLLLLWGLLIPVSAAVRVVSGSFANLFVLPVILGGVYWLNRRAVPASLIALGIGLYVVLNPLKGAYREAVWYSGQEYSAIEKLEILERLLFEPSEPMDRQRRNATLVSRISHITTLERAMVVLSGGTRYEEGATIAPLVYSWVPRAIWQDKPQELLGNTWARKLGFIGEGDFTTSYNLPWLVELYINFGTEGAIIGMGVVGALFAVLSAVIFPRGNDILTYIWGFSLTFGLWWPESNISLMLGSLVPILLLTGFGIPRILKA